MRHSRLLAVMIITACLFSSCLKEGNCPNCPRSQTDSKGKVIFFAKTNCEGGSPYTVIVDDTIHVAVVVSSSVPDCGTAGVVPIALRAGSHKWNASCNSQENVVSGIINVSANGCLVKEIRQ